MSEKSVIAEDDLFQLVDPHLTKHVLMKFSSDVIASEEVNACYLELLKFLFLTSKYPCLRGSFIPVTRRVDDFWHEVILQTRYYQKLCQNLPSGEFIHHESMPYDSYKEHKTKDQLIKEILRWIVFYVTHFDNFSVDRVKYWFFVLQVMKVLDLDLDSLNRYAKNTHQRDAYMAEGGLQSHTVASGE